MKLKKDTIIKNLKKLIEIQKKHIVGLEVEIKEQVTVINKLKQSGKNG